MINFRNALSSTKYSIRRVVDYIPWKIRQQKLKKWFLMSKYVDELKKLKNTHEGDRCFIIGNGPSLSVHDLDKLINEYTFACNKIYMSFDKVLWRPTYYTVADSDRFGKNGLVSSDSENIINVDAKIKFVGLENSLHQKDAYEDSNDIIIYRKETHLKGDYPFLSEDISYAVYGGHTILFDAAQIAIYMGFSEIYIIGVDANYNTVGDSKHFYSTNDNSIQNKHTGSLMIMAFQALKDFAETKNVKIYNATRGGKLEIFERVELDDVIRR